MGGTKAGEIKTTIEPKDAKEVLFRLGYPESVAKSTSGRGHREAGHQKNRGAFSQ